MENFLEISLKKLRKCIKSKNIQKKIKNNFRKIQKMMKFYKNWTQKVVIIIQKFVKNEKEINKML